MKSKIKSGPGSVSTAPLPHRMANALRLAQRNIRQLDQTANLNEYGYAIRDQALDAIGAVLAEWDGLPSIDSPADIMPGPEFIAGRRASVLRELVDRAPEANWFLKADAFEALALFDHWWHDIGSGIPPLPDEEACDHARRVALAAVAALAGANTLLAPLADLLDWAKGNRGTRTGNPYMVPEVRAALRALADATGFHGDPVDVSTAPRPAAGTKPLAGVSGSLLFNWLANGSKRCLCCGAPVPAGQSCPCQADTFTPCPQCGAPKPVGLPCPCIPTA